MGELSGWYEGENGAVQFYARTKVGQDMVDLLGDMYAGDPDFGFTDMEVDYDGKDVTAEVYGIMKQVSFIKLMGGSGDG
jgi:hypothetical protein